MRTCLGRFPERAEQASAAILDLEKAMQGKPNDQGFQGFGDGINLCEAILVGGRWSPETPSVDPDSVVLFGELRKHDPDLVEEQQIKGLIQTLRMIGEENGPSLDQMKSAQEFFLRALEAINSVRGP